MESITQETQDMLQLLSTDFQQYISVTIVPFAHMQIAQITITTFLIPWYLYEFQNYRIFTTSWNHFLIQGIIYNTYP